MSKPVDVKAFALAVVSGNSVTGDSSEEKSEKALDLYFKAMAVAEAHNKSLEPDPAEKKKRNEDTYNSIKNLGL
ncbi:hypothetical protein EQV77_00765 [Halobacillus fulvus]|nr:hypothetical protein EQV77_00765 [Halobacillus fulvus]